MWRYIVRRLLWVAVVVLIITLITFLIFFVMPPTDPAVAFAGKQPTPEAIAQVRPPFRVASPVWVQYWLFLKHLFAGDQYGWPGLGFSFATRQSARSLLHARVALTAQLGP